MFIRYFYASVDANILYTSVLACMRRSNVLCRKVVCFISSPDISVDDGNSRRSTPRIKKKERTRGIKFFFFILSPTHFLFISIELGFFFLLDKHEKDGIYPKDHRSMFLIFQWSILVRHRCMFRDDEWIRKRVLLISREKQGTTMQFVIFYFPRKLMHSHKWAERIFSLLCKYVSIIRDRESEYHFNHTHTYTGVTNHSDARERENDDITPDEKQNSLGEQIESASQLCTHTHTQ